MPVVETNIEEAYALARERYAQEGVDTEQVLSRLDAVPISIQCWLGVVVLGFESADSSLTGGIQTTGCYSGRAGNAGELRSDLEVALALIPGAKRLNLHAIYLESHARIERDKIEPRHFQG